MLSPLVEHGIGSNVKRTLVVAIEHGLLAALHPKVTKNKMEPLQLTRSRSKSPVLSFRRGLGCYGLFLSSLADK